MDDVIAEGESDRVEFKSSLHHPHGEPDPTLQAKFDARGLTKGQVEAEIRRQLEQAVTKTIAAFLNSDGGMLLVGVDDTGAVVGIEADFPHLRPGKQNEDGWQLSLQQVVIGALGPEVWSAVHLSLVRRPEGTVAVVSCPGRLAETWYREKGQESERFYIRAGCETRELKGSALVTYAKEHWAQQ